MYRLVIQLLLFFFLTILYSHSWAKVEIKISGVDGVIKDNVTAYLNPSQFDCLKTEGMKNAYLKSIPELVNKATRPYGFYNTDVSIEVTNKNDDCLSMNLEITMDKPVVLRSLDLKIINNGQVDKNIQKIIKQPGLAVGKALVHAQYNSLKSTLLSKAQELGYLDAEFSHNVIDIYPDEYAADISLHLNRGLRYRIANIEIIQETDILDEQFIRDMIDLKEGQFFSQKNFFQMSKKLKSTAYFEQVLINIDEQEKQPGEVPIKISLTASDRIKYSAGVGFSTDSGPRIGLDYQHFRLTDFGRQFNSQLSLSSVASELSAGIKIPSKEKALKKWFNIDLGYRIERSDSVSSDIGKLGFSQTRVKNDKWQNVNYLDIVNERFLTGDEVNRSTLLVPGINWTYINADDLVVPRKGFRLQSEIRGATDAILSDVSFIQLSASIKAITSIGDRHRFIFRSELATTETSDFDQLPSTFRFFAGGDQSIRGYNFQELGPTDDEGNVIGGQYMATAGIEYEYRVSGPWAAVVFTDFGNAFNDDFNIEKSVGTGLRWFSPIGPIRLDVGFPINGTRDFNIHITLGPDL